MHKTLCSLIAHKASIQVKAVDGVNLPSRHFRVCFSLARASAGLNSIEFEDTGGLFFLTHFGKPI